MLRLFAKITLALLSNAVGLLAASLLLDNFSLDALSFVTATLIFTITTVVLGPLIIKIALNNAPYLMGGIALVTTFVGLVITNLLATGISISGVSTWLVATLIVWGFSVLGSVVLPLVLFKKTLEKNKEN
jgi:hypothetical protein